MVGTLFIILICVALGLFYKFVWRSTRTKLNYENEKYDFLLNQHKHLIQSKNEKVTNISVKMPHNGNKPWKVFKTVKFGTWPFDKENDVEIYSIMDADLENKINDDIKDKTL